MRSHYTLARLHLDALLSGNLTLSSDHAHYLARVLRLRVGDRVRLFNARDGEVAAEIIKLAKREADVRVTERLRAPYTPPALTLLFAPLKRARTATIMEKATELGATCLQPVITARTQFPKLNLERMRAQIVEAAEQTERLDLPELREARPVLDAVGDVSGTVLMGDEAGDGAPMLDVLDTSPAAVLVGPEGGWSPEEREALRGMEHVRAVSLGPRILRADTAAISMLTLVQAKAGDW